VAHFFIFYFIGQWKLEYASWKYCNINGLKNLMVYLESMTLTYVFLITKKRIYYVEK